GSERRVRRVDLEVASAAFLARCEQERLGVVIAVVLDGQHHAGLGDPVVGRGLADFRVAQELLQVTDASFLLALFLTGGVVTTVLLEVAFLAAVVDPRGDDRTILDQLIELVLEPVVGILGQPGHLGVAHGHHLLLACRTWVYRTAVTHRAWFEIKERHGPSRTVPMVQATTKRRADAAVLIYARA